MFHYQAEKRGCTITQILRDRGWTQPLLWVMPGLAPIQVNYLGYFASSGLTKGRL